MKQTSTPRVALVTGAGSGIGKAIAQRLARDGALVVAADVTGGEQETAQLIGDACLPVSCDVSDTAAVARVEQLILDRFGRLDVLANNAGIGGARGAIHEMAVADFQRVQDVNVTGAFLVLQAGIRLMLSSGGGSIINTSSIGGFRATAGSSAYIISKGASVMMTRVAAIEYAQSNIRVNAVAPGTISTPIIDGIPESLYTELVSRIPQARFGTADEVANVVAFLASDESSHVTGQIWMVDGGRSAG